ncbi:PEPxxWA-CTERM sorting domain-containing protein [Sandaracinobacter sp. RS1-74]|uniref:PEPxxWA-CTERM sorting domain-containing protein n=1 Tax=Sandaracinobacteroides sayramensis TaxID=2913411 RepID=UPI001EDB6520|nr:PEPxxWA-CTERM sorting domain-containing protein [Sandaracinobacteroides sayramensis]MCG2842180.1 PEPxxWA-CTERM sorting domain-containing protein [Sandaracinobacteroides sayramensis]
MQIVRIALLAACAATFATPAAAAVITFDDATPGHYYTDTGPTIDGFRFVAGPAWGGNPPYNLHSYRILRQGEHPNADPKGQTLRIANTNTMVTVSKIDGSTFELVSIDLADAFNTGDITIGATLFFNTVDGWTSETVYLDHLRELQTFTFNRAGLLSFSVANTREWSNYSLQFDNVVIGDPVVPGTPGGVPEPAAWAMLIAGFGLVGSAMRRRRAVPA